MPPASNRMTRLGEQVRWASMAVAQGTPVPTATVQPSSTILGFPLTVSSTVRTYGPSLLPPTEPLKTASILGVIVEKAREALKLLAAKFPEEFPDWVLIGGGACWFYRESLRIARAL